MEIVRREEFLRYLSKFRERTDRLLPLVPPEAVEWAPGEGRFSLGDLLRHLAGADRYMFAENVRFRPSRYPGHARDLADGHAALLDYWRRLRAEAAALYAEIPEEDFARKCETPGGAALSVGKWLRAMFEHEAHHRGQVYLYLGLLGVATPPLYGLTSEEVRERSAARQN